MKKEKFIKLRPEIQEYIQYMLNIGIINSSNKEMILEKLSRTEINDTVQGEEYGGRTYLEGNKIIVEICKDKIETEAKQLGIDYEKLLYINIFHELTHACSILDNEIEEQMKNFFSELKIENKQWVNRYGYTIINEYIAQSLAQKLVEEKYKDKNMYPQKQYKFIYDKCGRVSCDSAYSYEYNSELIYYGEIEQFALKFIESVYGKKDVSRLYKDHFSGDFIKILAEEFKKRKNGLNNLYQMFGNMCNILVSDYIQQGYFEEEYPYYSVERFKKSIEEFNRIADIEIDSQQRV